MDSLTFILWPELENDTNKVESDIYKIGYLYDFLIGTDESRESEKVQYSMILSNNHSPSLLSCMSLKKSSFLSNILVKRVFFYAKNTYFIQKNCPRWHFYFIFCKNEKKNDFFIAKAIKKFFWKCARAEGIVEPFLPLLRCCHSRRTIVRQEW